MTLAISKILNVRNLLTQLIHDLFILLPQTLIFSLSLNGSFVNNSYYFLPSYLLYNPLVFLSREDHLLLFLGQFPLEFSNLGL